MRAFSGLCSLMAYLSARERKLFAIEPSRHQLKVSFSYDVVMIMSEGEKRGVMT